MTVATVLGNTTTLAALVKDVWDIMTGNPVLLVFICAGLVTIKYRLIPLTEVQEDLKKLRDIRYWVRKATPGTEESKEPPKKQPLKEVLQDKADEKKAQKNAPAQTKHKQQDMEL